MEDYGRVTLNLKVVCLKHPYLYARYCLYKTLVVNSGFHQKDIVLFSTYLVGRKYEMDLLSFF